MSYPTSCLFRAALFRSYHVNCVRSSGTRASFQSNNVFYRPTIFYPVCSRAFSATSIFETYGVNQAQVTVEGQTIAEKGNHVPKPNSSSNHKNPTAGSGSAKTEDDWTELLTAQNGILRGQLSSTNSHLLRLTLPLPSPSHPCAFVLHPSQPLSYLGRLIAAELPNGQVGRVEFKGFGTKSKVRWSDSTDIGDFIKQAAHVRSFTISFYPSSSSSTTSDGFGEGSINTIEVSVPTFQDRTVYLRERLRQINKSLTQMGELKALCDEEAKRGAKRVAFSGLVGLIGYWGVVYWLTFQTSLGWDVMEPVTYLIGHGVLVSGYVYWLIHSREPGYGAILTKTISHRQATLYNSHGFDLERYKETTAEGIRVRNEIQGIAIEYGVEWWEDKKGSDNDAIEAVPEVRENKHLEQQAEKLDQKRLEGETG